MVPPYKWLERIIRIDSTTERSNAELVHFLVPLIKKTGLQLQEQRVRENGRTFINLVAFNHSPFSPDLLVLHTHLDTVSGGEPKRWTQTSGDPYRLTRVGDKLYGLGTADVKLDFLCKLVAIDQTRPHRPVALVGSYGEERGLVGTRRLIEGRRISPKLALVGEPSELVPIYAHKGHLIVTVAFGLGRGRAELERRWSGEAAHSSTPHLGKNALNKALAEIASNPWTIVSLEGGTDSNRVPDEARARLCPGTDAATARILAFHAFLNSLSRKLRKERDRRFSPSHPTVSLNLACTRGQTVELVFDVRLLPRTHASQLKRAISQRVNALGGKIVALDHDPALDGHRRSALMKLVRTALVRARLPLKAATKASSTEAALYAEAGAEAIVFGPGRSIGNVHRPNEHNRLRDLAGAVRFYSELLRVTP